MNTTDTDLLFQTDTDIAESSRRISKRKAAATIGSPYAVSTKPLQLTIIDDQAWIGEAGWQARCLDLCTKETIKVYRGHTGPVTSIALYDVPDREGSWKALFTGSWDKTIRVWNSSSGLLYILESHTDFIKCLTVIPGVDPLLLSSSSDKTIKVWDLKPLIAGRRPTCVQTIREHTRPVDSIVWERKEDGTLEVFTADSMGIMKRWSVVGGRLVEGERMASHEAAVSMLRVNEEGLWSASVDKTARYLPFDGSSTISLPHTSSVRSVLPVPSDMTSRSLVLTGSDDENVRVWDIDNPDTPRLISTVEGHCGEVTGLVYWSGNGGMIISSSLDGTLRRWSMRDLLKPQPLVWEQEKDKVSMTEEEELELAELMDDA